MKTLFVLILLQLASCSLIDKNQKNSNKNSHVKSPVEYMATDVSQDLSSDSSVPTVDVENFGLYQKGTQNIKNERRVPVMALIFGPGLVKVTGHIAILQALKHENIKIHIVSGTGLGAFVAAFYALGMTPEKIEWIFHKFFKESDKLIPYSSEWRSKAKEILGGHIVNKRFMLAKRLLAIPLFDKKQRKIIYVVKGDLKQFLMKNLELEVSEGSGPSSPFSFGPFKNIEFFRSKGADLVVGLDSLGSNIKIKSSSDYLFGSLGRISSIISRQSELLDLYYQINLGDGTVDNRKNIPVFRQRGKRAGRDFLTKLKDRIKLWQNEGIE